MYRAGYSSTGPNARPGQARRLVDPAGSTASSRAAPVLRRLSTVVENAERITRSSSVGGGKRTITRSVRELPILTPDDLRSLPAERALLLPSELPPVLVRAVPWWDGDQAAAVRASIAAAAS